MKRVIALVLACLLPLPAWAQQPARSFEELQSQLKVKVDDIVYVTGQSGERLKGRILGLSATSLRLAVNGTQRDLRETTIREIKKRRPDRWWDGALLGAVIGAAAGYWTGWSLCDGGDCGEGGLVNPGFAVFGAGIGAGAGALADLSIRRFDTLYANPSAASVRSLRLSPVVSKGTKGLQLSVTF